ncbi:putative retrotransposon hot spot protein (RHS) [Trypanosoma cruzi]|uniref:Putative retrotransposon hot spot protein (RHS) n=1 Tax=Trypanosoma cruzi TaxID=5693 RepID=A0A2V2W718_TRYCR|nr:putative retrotransposon hot spot protein (RHS) [Trypanosoma cruzi]
MRLPRRRGTQRRRAHRRNWRECTSLCTMRAGPCGGTSGRRGAKENGDGNGVHEGKPGQSWSYREADDAIEENDAVQQCGAAPPVLMVLASEKGWPHSWNTIQDLPKDVFVNREVDRVWRIVKGDVTAWSTHHGGTDFKPKRRVLIGTPGIGKSMVAGSYLLYQLLHCDVEKLQVVVHCFGEEMRTCLTRPPER